jgi:hypothetical protein
MRKDAQAGSLVWVPFLSGRFYLPSGLAFNPLWGVRVCIVNRCAESGSLRGINGGDLRTPQRRMVSPEQRQVKGQDTTVSAANSGSNRLPLRTSQLCGVISLKHPHDDS